MTTKNHQNSISIEVTKVVSAILKARREALDSTTINDEAKQDAADLAQESILNELPNNLRVAALAAMEKALLIASGAYSYQSSIKWDARPSSIPSHIPKPPKSTYTPEYPELGLDHPDARDVWEQAHLDLAKARYMLEPKILRAYSEAQLEVERWEARQRSRKPSGDLRHPVPRNRLSTIAKQMSNEHERAIAYANGKITAINTGDISHVEIENLPGTGNRSGPSFPTLILRSDLDRRAAERAARENLTDEQRELEDAKWERIVDELLAELIPEDPEPEILYLPDLPRDRDPTEAEVQEFVNALRVHTDKVELGRKIEAKRQSDAQTKIRTKQRLEAEMADPEGAAVAKKEVARTKAAERQRRFRERQKSKATQN